MEFSRSTCSAVADRNLILAAFYPRQSALYSAMLTAVTICGNSGAGGNVSGVFIEVTSMLLTAAVESPVSIQAADLDPGQAKPHSLARLDVCGSPNLLSVLLYVPHRATLLSLYQSRRTVVGLS